MYNKTNSRLMGVGHAGAACREGEGEGGEVTGLCCVCIEIRNYRVYGTEFLRFYCP